MKMIKYPSTNQFRAIVQAVRRETMFNGLDSDGEAIYVEPDQVEFPKKLFRGTVKLHGSNGSIAFNKEDGWWVQSRRNILSLKKDNAGFCAYVTHILGDEYIRSLFEEFEAYTDNNTVIIYGEWCGGNIQKGVGLNGLDKMFVLFGVKVSPKDENKTSFWINFDETELSKLYVGTRHLYSINKFPVLYQIIDFNEPEKYVEPLTKVTQLVEERCPVASTFNPNGENLVGEGIVWSHYDPKTMSYLRFKVVGEKHSKVKTKKIVTVDPIKLKKVSDFVRHAVTEARLEQGFQEVFEAGEVSMKDTGTFIKWILKDVEKEELDTLTASGLILKDVNSEMAKKTVNWFKNRIFV